MRIWAPIFSSFRRMVPHWAQGAEQDIGEGGKVQADLVGAQGVGAGGVGEQVELLLLDGVFHVPAGGVVVFVEGAGAIALGGQGGDHEAGVGALG
jgi:hypothetical protein